MLCTGLISPVTSISLCVSGITLQDKFHTSRYQNCAIPTHELLYAASFARILGRNVIVIALGEQCSNYRKSVK